MILNKIKFINFRQFNGEQEISFATDNQRNITVIHGENGSGKTTLLNALTWCLYKELSPDFENPSDLLSRKAFRDSRDSKTIKCGVELEFTDCGINYLASRIFEYDETYDPNSSRPIKEHFSVTEREGGETIPLKRPEFAISRIIPKELHSYFFFNGERIDKLAKRSNSSELRKAIKTLLGVTILERTISHLRTVKKELLSNFKASGKNDERLKEAVSKSDSISSNLVSSKELLEQHKKNLEGIYKAKDVISETLSSLKETQQIKKTITTLEEQELQCKKELENIDSSIKKLLTRNACCSLMAPMMEKVNVILKDLKTSNILPSNVKEDFIKRLLENNKCICERDLLVESSQYKSVEKLLDYAINREVDTNISNMKAQLHGVSQKLANNPRELNSFIFTRAKLKKKIDDVIRKIDDEKRRIKGLLDHENIQSLVAKDEELDAKLLEETKKQALVEREIPDLENQKKDCEKAIERLKSEVGETDQTFAQMNFCDAILEHTQQIYDKRIDEIRLKLTEKMNTIFRKICKKDYYIKLDEDFNVNVVDSTDDDAQLVGKGTGENQISSLAFVGSILEFSKEVSEKDDTYGEFMKKYGGNYPLVMDSPFGSLDYSYGSGIAETLPSLANQVVIMVSSSQWRDEVSEPMLQNVGKRFTMSYYSSRKDTTFNTSIKGDSGEEYNLWESTDDEEYTKIREVL